MVTRLSPAGASDRLYQDTICAIENSSQGCTVPQASRLQMSFEVAMYTWKTNVELAGLYKNRMGAPQEELACQKQQKKRCPSCSPKQSSPFHIVTLTPLSLRPFDNTS
jgi:hypothetical protein